MKTILPFQEAPACGRGLHIFKRSSIRDWDGGRSVQLLTVITLIHVLVCIALVMIVLLQAGKGAEMGAAFGGSSQTLFGSAGAMGFLTKLTTIAAVVFMITSLLLALSSTRKASSVIREEPAQSAPAPVLPESVPVQPQTPASEKTE